MSAVDTAEPVAGEQAGEQPQQPRRADADSEVRKMMKDTQGSAFKKYRDLVYGRPGLIGLMWFEIVQLLFSNVPGALGLVLRKKFYRGLFKQCGRGVVFGKGITLRHPHRVVIGDNVVIDDHCVLDGKGDVDNTITIGPNTIIGRNTVLSCKGGTITLDDRVNISVNCSLLSETGMTIGKRVLIAGHCYLIAGGNHGIDRVDIPILDQPMIKKHGVRIDDHCWLGANVTMMDGVHVGRDSVVAAGAVVNKDVPQYTIVAGVPAKVIRDRKAWADEHGNDETQITKPQ